MKFRQILTVVPRAMRIAALCFGLGVVIVPVVGFIVGAGAGQIHHHALPPRPLAAFGLFGFLILGCFIAAWLLCLGFVYGDARRRAMPAVPWTLLAMFVPNLLGFLFYFVMRRPIGSPCPQCGQPMVPDRRFCSWCGYRRSSTPAGTSSGPDDPGLNPTATA